ncbi:hypothetical protein MPTK1_2g25000 [Marchantia polymorpha subsp. ruderalis]
MRPFGILRSDLRGRGLLNPTEVKVQAQEGCYHGPIICNHIKSQFLIPSTSGGIAHGV